MFVSGRVITFPTRWMRRPVRGSIRGYPRRRCLAAAIALVGAPKGAHIVICADGMVLQQADLQSYGYAYDRYQPSRTIAVFLEGGGGYDQQLSLERVRKVVRKMFRVIDLEDWRDGRDDGAGDPSEHVRTEGSGDIGVGSVESEAPSAATPVPRKKRTGARQKAGGGADGRKVVKKAVRGGGHRG